MSLMLGILIPVVSKYIYWNSSNTFSETNTVMTIPEMNEVVETISEQNSYDNWLLLVAIIFFLGAAFHFGRLILGLIRIKDIHRNSSEKTIDGFKVNIITGRHMPFSFMNRIYINSGFLSHPKLSIILKHEQVHCNHWHSLDVLFVELLSCVFWFNPILSLYKKRLKANHEFIADDLSRKESLQEYKSLLRSSFEQNYKLSFANSFFNSKIKSRIMSLESKKKKSVFRYFGILPIILVLGMYMSQNNVAPPDVNPKEIYKEILNLRKECKDLPIGEALKKFNDYYTDRSDGLDTEEIQDFQTTMTEQGAKNGMRITFLNNKEFGNLQFVVPFEKLESFKKGEETEAYSQMINGNTVTDRMMKRLHDDDLSNDPLIVINGSWASVTEYLKVKSASSSTHMTEKLAISKYGEKGKYGAIIMEDVKFRNEAQGDEVDEMPRFPGCEHIKNKEERSQCSQMELIKFIGTNLDYPQEARKKGVEGTCVVKFVVEQDGSLSGIEIMKDIGYGTGEESLKAVNAINQQNIKWIPGIKDGKKVKVEFKLPIKFKLGGGKKKK